MIVIPNQFPGDCQPQSSAPILPSGAAVNTCHQSIYRYRDERYPKRFNRSYFGESVGIEQWTIWNPYMYHKPEE